MGYSPYFTALYTDLSVRTVLAFSGEVLLEHIELGESGLSFYFSSLKKSGVFSVTTTQTAQGDICLFQGQFLSFFIDGGFPPLYVRKMRAHLEYYQCFFAVLLPPMRFALVVPFTPEYSEQFSLLLSLRSYEDYLPLFDPHELRDEYLTQDISTSTIEYVIQSALLRDRFRDKVFASREDFCTYLGEEIKNLLPEYPTEIRFFTDERDKGVTYILEGDFHFLDFFELFLFFHAYKEYVMEVPFPLFVFASHLDERKKYRYALPQITQEVLQWKNFLNPINPLYFLKGDVTHEAHQIPYTLFMDGIHEREFIEKIEQEFIPSIFSHVSHTYERVLCTLSEGRLGYIITTPDQIYFLNRMRNSPQQLAVYQDFFDSYSLSLEICKAKDTEELFFSYSHESVVHNFFLSYYIPDVRNTLMEEQKQKLLLDEVILLNKNAQKRVPVKLADAYYFLKKVQTIDPYISEYGRSVIVALLDTLYSSKTPFPEQVFDYGLCHRDLHSSNYRFPDQHTCILIDPPSFAYDYLLFQFFYLLSLPLYGEDFSTKLSLLRDAFHFLHKDTKRCPAFIYDLLCYHTVVVVGNKKIETEGGAKYLESIFQHKELLLYFFATWEILRSNDSTRSSAFPLTV